MKRTALFLIDSSGAMLSALLLFVLLAQHTQYFGMPAETLYFLGGIAIALSLFALCCYLFATENPKRFLRILAGSNFTYCALTIVLLIVNAGSLTTLGVIYFILEILVISILSVTELKAASVIRSN